MNRSRNVGLCFLAGLGTLSMMGCVRFDDRSISSDGAREEFEGRTLTDPGLRAFLETNGVAGPWPRTTWDFQTLTLAALYFQPGLDVARAAWATATAGVTAASERPNPTLSVTPGYNPTTPVPTPWFVTPSLDIPIETAGKRKFRIDQAGQLSEAARLKILSTAWQVRSRVRSSLANLDAARSKAALLDRLEELQTQSLQLIESQHRAGAVSAFEVTQARVALNQTRLARHDAARTLASSRLVLAEAVGVPSTALDPVELDLESFRTHPVELPDAATREQALRNRTDLLAALADYAASQAALQLEIAHQYPDLHITPGYDFDQGENKWSLGLSVTLPVLNQNQGGIALARARREESAARFYELQARVLAEIEQAVAGYRMALDKAATALALKQALSRQSATVAAMLEAGQISRLELTQHQLELTTAGLAQLDAEAAVQSALGTLDDALQSPVDWIAGTVNSPRISRVSPP